MRKSLLTFVAAVLLAGCGAAPTTTAGSSRLAVGAKALVDTSRHRHMLVVPADVMGYADAYLAQQHAKLDKGTASSHFSVTLIASADHFKRTFEAAIDRYNPRNAGGNQMFMLDEDAPIGDVEYYLVIKGMVTSVGPNSLNIDDSVPDFYISNFGKNWHATLK